MVEFNDPGGEDGRGSAEAGRGGQDIAMRVHRAHLTAGDSEFDAAPGARRVGNAVPEPLAVRSFSSAVGHRWEFAPHMRKTRPDPSRLQQKIALDFRFSSGGSTTAAGERQAAARKSRVTMDPINR